jgi:ATP-dependent exoDNAse (exonuclease V) beta subunit
MTNPTSLQTPPDHGQRLKAVDTAASVIVEAPAGSGKTTLLTQRFLALLAIVEHPRQIVAITFTTAAAAEMRHRILDQLAKAAENDSAADPLAFAAFARAQEKGWNLLEEPASLRISTIDSFCRDLAVRHPLLSGLGTSLTVSDQPEILYRKAAQQTLAQIDDGPDDLKEAISTLLLWRDNSWHEIEAELVKMLATRDRWMQGFVFDANLDEASLREALERPFARAAIGNLNQVAALLAQHFSSIQALGSFAAANLDGNRFQHLASCPSGPFEGSTVETGLSIYREVADLLLTKQGTFRAKFTKTEGFPTSAKTEKAQIEELVAKLACTEGLDQLLAGILDLPALRYSDEAWRIVRACFVLLRHAVARLKVVISEVGCCDFVEIAQLAQQSLISSVGAYAAAEEIQHLLVDEFQDTSRRQHRLLSDLVGLWSNREGRTVFFVGDPRQSIYFFRDAEVELFSRIKNSGLEIGPGDSLGFSHASLSANFRTEPALVDQMNGIFEKVFAEDDGSGLKHVEAIPARTGSATGPLCRLHLEFVPAATPFRRLLPEQIAMANEAEARQRHQLIELIRSYQPQVEEAQKEGKKYRIAVLGRTHKALLPVAEDLRAAGIPFRAIDLEPLAERPEVTDALALAKAFLNPEDRVAWLGALRAPWCGISLHELHTLTSADDSAILSRPVPVVAFDRLHLLSPESQAAVRRVLQAASEAGYLRASQPTQSLGAWLETVWLNVGGASCVDSQGRANMDLLWSALDSLQNGEQDLLGPALDAALDSLKAQPDPHASANAGVQLMTIHKSKGLEFEIVIVPELQSEGYGGGLRMLSWMERGLSAADDSGDLTEFLIAPFSPKGEAGSGIKKWVDREIRNREKQEMRRLLYVAATRARDELHLFARPGYRMQGDEDVRVLATPAESLLGTAWPALEQEVRTQFDSLPYVLPAAGAIQRTSSQGLAIVRRLPADFAVSQSIVPRFASEAEAARNRALYARESGGLESRLRGSAVHFLMEKIADLRKRSLSWKEVPEMLSEETPKLVAQIRAAGMSLQDAHRISEDALNVAVAVLDEDQARWVLDNHPEAESETRWTGILAGEIHTVQPDRVFRAGDEPGASGATFWIVDYKTAILEDPADHAKVAQLRAVFAPQLDVYSQMLRNLHPGAVKVNVGIYYPRTKMLDWWSTQAA